MKFITTLLLTASLSTTAFACPVRGDLTRTDVALADVIFEGDIEAIRPTIYYNKYAERDQVREMELIFRVSSVIRGSAQSKTLTIGWVHGTFGYPKTLSEFKERYGESMRVAVTTPNQMKKLCSSETYSLSRLCSAHSGYGERFLRMPFVLNGPCTGAYMYPYKTEEDQQVYAKHYEGINRGDGSNIAKNTAFEIAKLYADELTPEFKSDAAAQARLGQLVYDTAKKNSPAYYTLSKDPDSKARFIQQAVNELKHIAAIFEVDPEFEKRVIDAP